MIGVSRGEREKGRRREGEKGEGGNSVHFFEKAK